MAVPGLTWPHRLIFLAVGLICLVGGPYSALIAFLRAGRLGDRQVVRRRERHVLVAVANLIMKASFHTAVCAGAAVILWMLWWLAGLVLGVATPAVGWARQDDGRPGLRAWSAARLK